MKIKDLINKLEEQLEKHGNCKVICETYENDIREYIEKDIDYLTTINNSYDKRLKQETKIVLHLS